MLCQAFGLVAQRGSADAQKMMGKGTRLMQDVEVCDTFCRLNGELSPPFLLIFSACGVIQKMQQVSGADTIDDVGAFSFTAGKVRALHAYSIKWLARGRWGDQG